MKNFIRKLNQVRNDSEYLFHNEKKKLGNIANKRVIDINYLIKHTFEMIK